MKEKKIAKVSPKKSSDFKKAEQNYSEMWKKIEPFIKKRKLRQPSTTGQWRVTSCEP